MGKNLYLKTETNVFDISIVKPKDKLLLDDGRWYDVKNGIGTGELKLGWMSSNAQYSYRKIEEVVENIKDHEQYVPRIRYMGASSDIESYVIDNNTLVYLETIGQEDMVKSVLSVLMQGRVKMNDHAVDASFGMFNINKAGNKRKIQNIDKGLAHAILYHAPSITKDGFNILIGRDKDEMMNSFSSWMQNSQPLPYPTQLTKEIYEKLQKKQMLEELESFNINAIKVDASVLEDEYKILQETIIEVCKDKGLIDPNAKPIKPQYEATSKYLTKEQVQKIYNTLNSMPKTYELEDMEIKPIGLKLFSPNMTLYITEADRGDESDEFENMHIQCYGYVKNESDSTCSEWGYINIPKYLELTYPNGGGFEQDLYFENMYINPNGKIGKLREFTKYRDDLSCPRCSSKQVEIHESIDGFHHCSCIDCEEMFNKKILQEVA